ncbi:hypothetical protein C7434_2590 [Pantoea sp. PNA 14-12]|uniref:hypothetical protein n=1 Tax=Pantoea TaxID=53335 RepID=UPI001060F067|nr:MULTISPECIES: hypothetical protein [Pantoea]TDS69202.1 hypothetical protein C7434_2590 [Pantoea sp. PNA 14-12]
MRFNENHLSFFNALDGAYSEISLADEATKSQITLTDHEKELAINFFGPDKICRGPVKSNPDLAAKEFKLYQNGVVRLNLVFPKPEKNELRLYMANGKDFYAPAGSIWFIYHGRGDDLLTVGYMHPSDWTRI